MGVPPQEVGFVEKYTEGNMLRHSSDDQCLGSYEGLGHCVCWCCGLLQVPTNLSSVLKELCSSNTDAHQKISTLLIARVSNATVSVANVEDCHSSTRLLAQVGIMICSFICAFLFFHTNLLLIRPHCGTSLARRTCTKSWATGRASQPRCRWIDYCSLYQLDINNRMVFWTAALHFQY